MTIPTARELLQRFGRGALYFVGFFVFAALVNWYQAPAVKDMPRVASLEVSALSGQKLVLDTAKNKKTIIYFFAPWCAVCKVSMDALNMFAEKENLQALAVGLDYQTVDELKPFQEKLRAPIFAGSEDLQRRFRVDRYPTVYILNRDGSIAHVMVGYTSRLGMWLRTLL